MAPTIEAFENETALTDSGLVQALVDQRRNRLEVDVRGLRSSITIFAAVGDVLGELLDGESVDRWRGRAAARLDRLGIAGPGALAA